MEAPVPLHELSQSEWPGFFDHFSRLHHGEPAQIEVSAGGTGQVCPVALAHDAPLMGITVEPGPGDVEIIAGGPPLELIDHTVSRPIRICVAEWNDGTSAAVEIEGADHRKVEVRVGPSERMLPPDMLTDGTMGLA